MSSHFKIPKILVLLALGACSASTTSTVVDDASPIDAPTDEPDAAPGSPDAHPTASPDAHPAGSPDAHQAGTPDAHPAGPPDAHVASPDAAPDAGPSCVGTWTTIPALVIGGTTINPAAVTASGDTIYELYARPGATGFLDLATYSVANGWQTMQSRNTIDYGGAWAFSVKSDHLVILFYSTTAGTLSERGVLGFASQMWTVTTPFSGWNPDFSPDTHSMQAGITSDFAAFDGGYYVEVPPGGGQETCSTSAEMNVFPLDDPPASTAATPAASPLASRGAVTATGGGDEAFFWGGIQWPDPAETCMFGTPTRLYDGAFYDPATGVWGVDLTLPAPQQLNNFAPPAMAFWDGSQAILLEKYNFGPTDNGQVHTASPGSVAFHTVDLPGEMSILWENSISTPADLPAIAATSHGLVAVTAASAYLFVPSTGQVTALCAPPVAFPATPTVEPFAGPTTDGAYIIRGNVAAYLHL